MYSVLALFPFSVQGTGRSHAPCWICPNMFNLDLTVQGPPGTFKLVHYEASTVGKRAVGIRLKCLLVLSGNCLNNEQYLALNHWRIQGTGGHLSV